MTCEPRFKDPLLYLCLSLWEQPDEGMAKRMLNLTLERYSLTKKELFPSLRLTLTGENDSPPIEKILSVMPIERSVYRLSRFAATSLNYEP